MHVRSVEGDERVTPLELFFDLVFVFALTQVTGFLAANESGRASCAEHSSSRPYGGRGKRMPG